jgi:hypothetical protein
MRLNFIGEKLMSIDLILVCIDRDRWTNNYASYI